VIVPNQNLEPDHETGSERRGAALLIALFFVVILATIVSAAAFVAQLEYRGSRNTLVEQRAFAVSEYGLSNEISNWDRGRNLPNPVGMAIGGFDTTRVYVAAGDSARVSIKRLSDTGFWVVSEGRANIGSQALESGRQTGAYVRIAYPTIEPKEAITSAGNVKLQGASGVSGYEHPPAGWPQCAAIPGDSSRGRRGAWRDRDVGTGQHQVDTWHCLRFSCCRLKHLRALRLGVVAFANDERGHRASRRTLWLEHPTCRDRDDV